MANALQRKANKADFEPRLAKIEQALTMSTSKDGQSLIERLNEIEKNLQDTKTFVDLRVDEKLSKKLNLLESDLKRLGTRDMMRLDNELLILNTNFSTLSTEHRNFEERLR